MDIKLTFDLLPALSVFLVLAAYLIPGYKDWFAKLTAEKKQLLNLGVLFGVDLAAVVLSLTGFLSVYQGPTWREWVWFPSVDFFIALMTLAGVYSPTKYVLGDKNAPQG